MGGGGEEKTQENPPSSTKRLNFSKMFDSFLRSHLFFATSFLPSCSNSLLAEILQLKKERQKERDRFI